MPVGLDFMKTSSDMKGNVYASYFLLESNLDPGLLNR